MSEKQEFRLHLPEVIGCLAAEAEFKGRPRYKARGSGSEPGAVGFVYRVV